jgi:hypothetical protein
MHFTASGERVWRRTNRVFSPIDHLMNLLPAVDPAYLPPQPGEISLIHQWKLGNAWLEDAIRTLAGREACASEAFQWTGRLLQEPGAGRTPASRAAVVAELLARPGVAAAAARLLPGFATDKAGAIESMIARTVGRDQVSAHAPALLAGATADPNASLVRHFASAAVFPAEAAKEHYAVPTAFGVAGDCTVNGAKNSIVYVPAGAKHKVTVDFSNIEPVRAVINDVERDTRKRTYVFEDTIDRTRHYEVAAMYALDHATRTCRLTVVPYGGDKTWVDHGSRTQWRILPDNEWELAKAGCAALGSGYALPTLAQFQTSHPQGLLDPMRNPFATASGYWVDGRRPNESHNRYYLFFRDATYVAVAALDGYGVLCVRGI